MLMANQLFMKLNVVSNQVVVYMLVAKQIKPVIGQLVYQF